MSSLALAIALSAAAVAAPENTTGPRPLRDRSGKEIGSLKVVFAKPLGKPGDEAAADGSKPAKGRKAARLTWYFLDGIPRTSAAYEMEHQRSSGVYCILTVEASGKAAASEPEGSRQVARPMVNDQREAGSFLQLEFAAGGGQASLSCNKNPVVSAAGHPAVLGTPLVLEELQAALGAFVLLEP